MTRHWPKSFMLCGALMLTALVMSCAEERAPIDRVQPYAIKKAMLKGTWYFAQKVVETPGSELFAGFYIPSVVGWWSDPERVVFEIQEGFLNVRRARELVEGAGTYVEDYPDGENAAWVGDAILASYRIVSHFDIQRDYNPVTGESMNIIEENKADRPWWEREYMRVDWSENLVPGYQFLHSWEPAMPTPYFVQNDCTPEKELAANPNQRCVPQEDAPFFDITWSQDGTKLIQGYFDVTNVATAAPASVELEGYGEIPACWYFDLADCSSTIYHTRNSFWKIDPDKDFEPLPYKGPITDQMGFFASEQLTYDPQQAVSETGRKSFAQIHNIWEQSHDYDSFDPAGGGCQTDEDCNEDTLWKYASQCDIYTPLQDEDAKAYEQAHNCKFHVTPQNLQDRCEPQHYCTLPYNERRVRPIVYYLNKEWPEELIHHPSEQRVAYQNGLPVVDTSVRNDAASWDAWNFAYADQEGEDRPALEQVSDQYNAAFTRMINILKTKAAGVYDPEKHANTPYLTDDMRRKEGGIDEYAESIGHIHKSTVLGKDHNWYDPQRPPFTICRFNPVLGPNHDPNDVEPDVCWERIQENSRCVFDPDEPGVNPETGDFWYEAQSWPICSEREASPRLGDVRYSMVYWVPKWYSGFALLGLGPGNVDPKTGETLSGSAHVYMHNDMAARRIVDATMLITGDLGAKDYIDGYNLLAWQDKFAGPTTNPPASPAQGYGLDRIAATSRSIDANSSGNAKFNIRYEAAAAQSSSSNGLPFHGLQEPDKVDGSAAKLPFTVDDLVAAAAASPIEHDGDAMVQSIAAMPGGTAIEAALLGDENLKQTLLAANGYDPRTANDLSIGDELSEKLLVTRDDPFRHDDALKALKDWITVEMRGDFGSLPVEAASDSLAYEVQRLRRQGRLPHPDDIDYDPAEFTNALWRLARKKLMTALSAHEIGHSIGLRHNFGGSDDPLNYFEKYWQIRANGCADIRTDGLAPDITDWQSEPGWNDAAGCGLEPTVGPRFVAQDPGREWSGDPLSKYEIYSKLYHHAYNSIMDYSGQYHIDEQGLGRYDWAAVLFGYGHMFEVYKEAPLGSWPLHKTLRPSQATADSPDNQTIVDISQNFLSPDIHIADNALVINMETGEKAYVDKAVTTETALGLKAPGFSSPMTKGQMYSVWGFPKGFDSPIINGYTFKHMLDEYLAGKGKPLVLFYTYMTQPHYTEWYRNWIGSNNQPNLGFNLQSNRDVRDVRDFDWRVRSQGNRFTPGFNLKGGVQDQSVVRVPYVYCTDNYNGVGTHCNARDFGADDWERFHNFVSMWEKWYISRAFVRRRVDFYQSGELPDYYYGTLYRTPKNFNDIFVLYNELFAPLYRTEFRQEAALMDVWNSWGSYTMAVHDAFNMLMQALASPDPFFGYSAENRWENGKWSLVGDYLEQGSAGFDISQGARVLETRYGNTEFDDWCGLQFWRCVWNIGWIHDKITAINSLSEAGTYFVGRTSAHDIRLFRISFFDDFNWQIKQHFSAMMGESWEDWAPLAITAPRHPNPFPLLDPGVPILPSNKAHPKLFWRDWANPENDITRTFMDSAEIPDPIKEALIDPNEETQMVFTPVDPIFGFTAQIYAMVLGMARFQHNYDLSFYTASRVWTEQGQNVTDEDEEDIISFHDPASGLTYNAIARYKPSDVYHPYKTDKEQGVGIGAAMIDFANKMRGRSHECDEIVGDNAHETATVDDDCCDNPYAEEYPLTEDEDLGVPCQNDSDCDVEHKQYCHEALRTCHYTDDCDLLEGAIFEDPDQMTPEQLEEARRIMETRRDRVDAYFLRYKGLLDFQTRLTNIYDEYMGFVGDEEDPGDLDD